MSKMPQINFLQSILGGKIKKRLTARIFTRVTALFLAIAMAFPSQGVSATVSVSETLPQPSLALSLSKVSLPVELGSIKEKFEGSDKKIALIVQDAHAVPEAQRNIQKIIEFSQEKYGIQLVGLEGAATDLNAQIFKSFPDQEKLKKVFEAYIDRGELSGGSAAAIFSSKNHRTTFHGIEDIDLYKEGLRAYINALQREPSLTKTFNSLLEQIQKEKKEKYSPRLYALDLELNKFNRNTLNLVDVLEKLALILPPKKRSELELLLAESMRVKSDQIACDSEVRNLAGAVKKLLAGGYSNSGIKTGRRRSVTPQDETEFNARLQELQTGQIGTEAFALFLKEFAERNGIPIIVSKKLNERIGRQRRMKDIEGSKLFDEFQQYVQAVKATIFRNDEERKIDQESRFLELLSRLIKLELTRDEWAEVQRMHERMNEFLILRDSVDHLGMISSLLSAMQPNFSFYENAQKRDGALAKRAEALLQENDSKSILIVAGGFHAEGLSKQLKARGISYCLMTPAIPTLPVASHYRDHMQGDVSWKKYFEVKNSKVNLHEAFVRGVRDQLLSYKASNVIFDQARNNKPQFSHQDLRLLKNWRDQIIRDLAAQNQITESSNLVRFIDEILSSPHFFDRSEEEQKNELLVEKWRNNVGNFLKLMRHYHDKNELTEQRLANLLNVDLIPDVATSPAAALGEIEVGLDLIPNGGIYHGERSEMRSEVVPPTGSILETLFENSAGELEVGRLRTWLNYDVVLEAVNNGIIPRDLYSTNSPGVHKLERLVDALIESHFFSRPLEMNEEDLRLLSYEISEIRRRISPEVFCKPENDWLFAEFIFRSLRRKIIENAFVRVSQLGDAPGLEQNATYKFKRWVESSKENLALTLEKLKRGDLKGKKIIFVLSHQNPDYDAVVSAVGEGYLQYLKYESTPEVLVIPLLMQSLPTDGLHPAYDSLIRLGVQPHSIPTWSEIAKDPEVMGAFENMGRTSMDTGVPIEIVLVDQAEDIIEAKYHKIINPLVTMIIDHHKQPKYDGMGQEKRAVPRLRERLAYTVGSTATLIAKHFSETSRQTPKILQMLLLMSLVIDSENMHSNSFRSIRNSSDGIDEVMFKQLTLLLKDVFPGQYDLRRFLDAYLTQIVLNGYALTAQQILTRDTKWKKVSFRGRERAFPFGSTDRLRQDQVERIWSEMRDRMLHYTPSDSGENDPEKNDPLVVIHRFSMWGDGQTWFAIQGRDGIDAKSMAVHLVQEVPELNGAVVEKDSASEIYFIKIKKIVQRKEVHAAATQYLSSRSEMRSGAKLDLILPEASLDEMTRRIAQNIGIPANSLRSAIFETDDFNEGKKVSVPIQYASGEKTGAIERIGPLIFVQYLREEEIGSLKEKIGADLNHVVFYPPRDLQWARLRPPPRVESIPQAMPFLTGHTSVLAALAIQRDNGLGWQNRTVADFYAGRGIMGLIALKLGAKKVYIIENDPNLLQKAEEVFQANGYGSDAASGQVSPVAFLEKNISANLRLDGIFPPQVQAEIQDVIAHAGSAYPGLDRWVYEYFQAAMNAENLFMGGYGGGQADQPEFVERIKSNEVFPLRATLTTPTYLEEGELVLPEVTSAYRFIKMRSEARPDMPRKKIDPVKIHSTQLLWETPGVLKTLNHITENRIIGRGESNQRIAKLNQEEISGISKIQEGIRRAVRSVERKDFFRSQREVFGPVRISGQRIARVFKWLGLGEGHKVLDLGHGYGDAAFIAASLFKAHARGFEINDFRFQRSLAAQRDLTDQKLVAPQKTDLQKGNFLAASWKEEDVIYYYSFGAVDNPDEIIKKLKAELKPGGHFVLLGYRNAGEPNLTAYQDFTEILNSGQFYLQRLPEEGAWVFTRAEMRQPIKVAGLKNGVEEAEKLIAKSMNPEGPVSVSIMGGGGMGTSTMAKIIAETGIRDTSGKLIVDPDDIALIDGDEYMPGFFTEKGQSWIQYKNGRVIANDRRGQVEDKLDFLRFQNDLNTILRQRKKVILVAGMYSKRLMNAAGYYPTIQVMLFADITVRRQRVISREMQLGFSAEEAQQLFESSMIALTRISNQDPITPDLIVDTSLDIDIESLKLDRTIQGVMPAVDVRSTVELHPGFSPKHSQIIQQALQPAVNIEDNIPFLVHGKSKLTLRIVPAATWWRWLGLSRTPLIDYTGHVITLALDRSDESSLKKDLELGMLKLKQALKLTPPWREEIEAWRRVARSEFRQTEGVSSLVNGPENFQQGIGLTGQYRKGVRRLAVPRASNNKQGMMPRQKRISSELPGMESRSEMRPLEIDGELPVREGVRKISEKTIEFYSRGISPVMIGMDGNVAVGKSSLIRLFENDHTRVIHADDYHNERKEINWSRLKADIEAAKRTSAKIIIVEGFRLFQGDYFKDFDLKVNIAASEATRFDNLHARDSRLQGRQINHILHHMGNQWQNFDGPSVIYDFILNNSGKDYMEEGPDERFSADEKIDLLTFASRPEARAGVNELRLLRPELGLRRILHVEDLETIRTKVKIALQRDGLEIVSAEDGQAGLDAVLDNGGNINESFDLILMDTDMPRLSGTQLLKELRGKGYEGPIVWYTGRPGYREREGLVVRKPHGNFYWHYELTSNLQYSNTLMTHRALAGVDDFAGRVLADIVGRLGRGEKVSKDILDPDGIKTADETELNRLIDTAIEGELFSKEKAFIEELASVHPKLFTRAIWDRLISKLSSSELDSRKAQMIAELIFKILNHRMPVSFTVEGAVNLLNAMKTKFSVTIAGHVFPTATVTSTLKQLGDHHANFFAEQRFIDFLDQLERDFADAKSNLEALRSEKLTEPEREMRLSVESALEQYESYKEIFASLRFENRRELAREYLEKMGIDFNALVPQQAVSFYSHDAPAPQIPKDPDFESRLVSKLIKLDQLLKRDIGIHVMASQGLPDITKLSFHGSAYVLRSGFLEAYQKIIDERLKLMGVELEAGTQELTVRLFLREKFLPAYLEGFSYGYKTKDGRPSLPVTLFVDYATDSIAKLLPLDGPRDLFLSDITLDYEEKSSFEDRLLGVIQWRLAEITKQTETGFHVGENLEILGLRIAEKYLDKLIEIAEAQNRVAAVEERAEKRNIESSPVSVAAERIVMALNPREGGKMTAAEIHRVYEISIQDFGEFINEISRVLEARIAVMEQQEDGGVLAFRGALDLAKKLLAGNSSERVTFAVNFSNTDPASFLDEVIQDVSGNGISAEIFSDERTHEVFSKKMTKALMEFLHLGKLNSREWVEGAPTREEGVGIATAVDDEAAVDSMAEIFQGLFFNREGMSQDPDAQLVGQVLFAAFFIKLAVISAQNKTRKFKDASERAAFLKGELIKAIGEAQYLNVSVRAFSAQNGRLISILGNELIGALIQDMNSRAEFRKSA